MAGEETNAFSMLNETVRDLGSKLHDLTEKVSFIQGQIRVFLVLLGIMVTSFAGYFIWLIEQPK